MWFQALCDSSSAPGLTRRFGEREASPLDMTRRNARRPDQDPRRRNGNPARRRASRSRRKDPWRRVSKPYRRSLKGSSQLAQPLFNLGGALPLIAAKSRDRSPAIFLGRSSGGRYVRNVTSSASAAFYLPYRDGSKPELLILRTGGVNHEPYRACIHRVACFALLGVRRDALEADDLRGDRRLWRCRLA